MEREAFLPSKHGWKFDNDWPHQPDIIVDLPLIGKVGIGDAANGLCGGMVYSALDYYLAGQPIPDVVSPPPSESETFKHIYKRLFDSFDIPWGAAKYYAWMACPSDEPLGHATYLEAVRLMTIVETHPVPLGMIRYYSMSPFRLGENHQILAYKLTTENGGTTIRIGIYDPNYAMRDDIELVFDAAKRTLEHSEDGPQRGFFITRYRTELP